MNTDERIGIVEAFKQLYNSTGPIFWIGILAMVLTVILELYLDSKKIIGHRREKKIEKAKAEGKVITAHMKSSYYDSHDDGKTANWVWTATYTYEKDGIKGKYVVVRTGAEPPSQITLYYDKTPKRCFSNQEKGDFVDKAILVAMYIFPIFVGYLVMKLLGFDFNSLG